MNNPSVRLVLPRSSAAVLIAFALTGGALINIERADYPDLHTILDTGVFLLAGVLGLLFWDMGVRVTRPFPRWIAVSFCVTALLECVHALVTVEWFGVLAPIAKAVARAAVVPVTASDTSGTFPSALCHVSRTR